MSKVALVTGGALRLGAAIVRRLAAEGWKVVIHCNTSLQPAEALAAELRGAGREAAVVQADATGVGQHVDVSMLGALTSLVACEPFDAFERSNE